MDVLKVEALVLRSFQGIQILRAVWLGTCLMNVGCRVVLYQFAAGAVG